MTQGSTGETLVSQLDEGRLAGNILLFCRTLRAAGLSIGPGQVLDALSAVREAGVERPEEFYWALRAALVTDPEHFTLFRQAFHVWFRRPGLLGRLGELLSADDRDDPAAGVAVREILEAAFLAGEERGDSAQTDADRTESWSRRELLRRKDFEQMTLAEQRAAESLLRREIEPLKDIRTRRFRASASGGRYDLRRTMQSMVRNNGQLTQLARKRRLQRPPTLVLICDISGSMSKYSRAFLHFAHALGSGDQPVHAFVFGTRLTNISRRLREKDVDAALARIASDVCDWDGGTRIAESLKRFNLDWNRRVLAENAVVVLLSDGLERDTESDLEFQMQRLRASCRELIWLNPVLRYRDFEPRADGIRKMLPHVDRFMPAHNIESLSGLVDVLTGRQGRFGDTQWRPRAAEAGA
jgi:uncharacterized protein